MKIMWVNRAYLEEKGTDVLRHHGVRANYLDPVQVLLLDDDDGEGDE